jgi:hypothetical protein
VATIRATQVLDGALPSDVALADLAALYIELNHLWDIQDFYLLRCAQQDLKGYLHQWYWPSATRENIDLIIEDRFRSWICEHPLK